MRRWLIASLGLSLCLFAAGSASADIPLLCTGLYDGHCNDVYRPTPTPEPVYENPGYWRVQYVENGIWISFDALFGDMQSANMFADLIGQTGPPVRVIDPRGVA